MTGFPLLRLPHLPLKSVLDQTHIWDLIRLHVCSKKTRVALKLLKKTEIIRNLLFEEKENLNILETLDLLRLETYNDPLGSLGCFPENSVTMTITVDSGNGIEVKLVGDYRISNSYQSCFPFKFYVDRIEKILASGTKGYFKFDRITVPVIMEGKHTIHTYFGKDQSDGLNVLVDFLKKFFNVQIIYYFIDGSMDPMFSHNLRTVVKGMAQETITKCEINNGNMNDDDYKYILDNVNPAFYFKHDNGEKSRSDDFRHNTSFSSVNFKLEPANWFTFENLITLDCANINLLESRLTNDDMCNYLKLWMTGKCSKLKSLTVELRESVSLEYILSELKICGVQHDSKTYREVDYIHVNKNNETVAKIRKIDGRNMIEFSVL